MYPLKIKEKYDRNNLENLWHRFSVPYLWNYRDWDYKEFSWSHPWVDIRPEHENQDVFSVLDWKIYKTWEDGSYWKYIFIEHENVPHPDDFSKTTTLFSCYEHLNEIDVEAWDIIKEWEKIWTTWNTWISFWEHLHFQIDRQEAPFHAYWPFTWAEVKNAWVSFSEGINIWLWQDKAKLYTVNPLVYLDEIENKSSTPIVVIEDKKEEIKVVANTTEKKVEEKVEENKNNNSVEKIEIKKSEDKEDIINTWINIENNNKDNENKEEKVIVKEDVKKEELKTSSNDDDSDVLKTTSLDDLLWNSDSKKKAWIIFKDIDKNNKFYTYINELAANWIIEWFSDWTFRPNNKVTRSEFLKLIFLVKQTNLEKSKNDYFIDVKQDYWQKRYVDTAVKLWLISTKNKYFNPNSYITRVEVLKISLLLFDVWIMKKYDWNLKDVNSGDWFSKYVEYSIENDLLPYDWNYFKPNEYATRIEVIQILYKLTK